jgi:hypothetical protein
MADWSSRGGGSRRHKVGHKAEGPSFLAGQTVPESGIYEVTHHRGHRVKHEVIMHRQDVFPACDQCGEKVRFRVLRTAPYIFDDEDFVEE